MYDAGLLPFFLVLSLRIYVLYIVVPESTESLVCMAICGGPWTLHEAFGGHSWAALSKNTKVQQDCRPGVTWFSLVFAVPSLIERRQVS